MEESEIDEWFNEQKELLEERFYAEATKDVYKAKARFDTDYKKLIKQLQERHDALYTKQLRIAQMQKPIMQLRDRFNLMVASIKQWIAQTKLAIKKWFFDRKIKRILKDKSDL